MYATAAKSPKPADPSLTYTHNLVDGPFAVVESGVGVSTTPACAPGVQGSQVIEPYDVEPWGSDHLRPVYQLVFCFLQREDDILASCAIRVTLLHFQSYPPHGGDNQPGDVQTARKPNQRPFAAWEDRLR